MQVYEEEPPVNYDLGIVLNDSISDEEKEKALLVGKIIDKFVESNKVKEDHEYGDLFDKFFDKEITELLIYKHIIDIDF